MCYVAQAKEIIPYFFQGPGIQCLRLLKRLWPKIFLWNRISATVKFIKRCSPWLFCFSLIFDPGVACQPLFCRETGRSFLWAECFSALFTLTETLLWSARYWFISPVSWIWLSNSKLQSWIMAGTWIYVESEDAAGVGDELKFFHFPQTVL